MMNRSRIAYHPSSITSPGETLAELLDERGISQAELAQRMAQSPQVVAALINGKEALTSTIADQLATIFAVPAGYWLNHERIYRNSLAVKRG